MQAEEEEAEAVRWGRPQQVRFCFLRARCFEIVAEPDVCAAVGSSVSPPKQQQQQPDKNQTHCVLVTALCFSLCSFALHLFLF